MKCIDANSRTSGSSLLALDANLFALQHELAKLRQHKQGLVQDLLTGRVSADAIVLDALNTESTPKP